MKKAFFSLAMVLALFVCTEASAQFKYFTGGRLNLQSDNVKDSNSNSSFGILPYIGYAPSANIVMGLGLGYSGSKNVFVTRNAISFMPFFRSRKQVNDKMGLYGEVNIPIQFGSIKETQINNSPTVAKSTSFGIAVGPGIDYSLSERWAINALWGALSYTRTSSEGLSSGQFGLNINPAALNFSLNYCF